jgi:hypothetical protein
MKKDRLNALTDETKVHPVHDIFRKVTQIAFLCRDSHEQI